jgi:hypothetical protein
MKSPWLAAVLNFFLFGVGTLYLGRRMVMAALITLGGNIVQALEIKMSPPLENWSNWPWLFSGLVLVKLALAVDGYQEAKALTAAPS